MGESRGLNRGGDLREGLDRRRIEIGELLRRGEQR